MNIAIIGATGLVGKKMMEVLEEKKLPIGEVYLYASERSAGTVVQFLGRSCEILELKEENVKNKKIDFALFSVEAPFAKIFAPQFVAIGAIVIDNSSAFRMDENVPLVVPEVNFEAIKKHHKIIANPNCSTIQAVVALGPLHKKFGLKRVVYSTYQAVSGAGTQGIDDLARGQAGEPPLKFPHPIYNNILPQIDDFTENGYTKEENKMINETRKILGELKLPATATTVRVPVENGHSESINAEFKTPATLDEVKTALKNAPGIVLVDDIANKIYPMSINCFGKDEVFVGRVRLDDSVKSGVNLWVVADNIRKGAATNAVQILEKLLK